MKKPNTISNETEALSDNVHRKDIWLYKQAIIAKNELSPKIFERDNKKGSSHLFQSLAELKI
jgi:hypothetical protein